MPRHQSSADVTPSTFQILAQRAPPKTVNYPRDGLIGVDRLPYRGSRSFQRVIGKRIEGFKFNGAAQYIVFTDVTRPSFEEISAIRDTEFKGLRCMYIASERILIIKFMVSIVHELAHRVFVRCFEQKLFEMGLDRELVPMGRIGFSGAGSKKEPDSSFKPSSRRFANNWPTLVIECGVAESLARLQVEAQWWLQTSAGDVKTVIVISVSVPERNFHLETWELEDMADPSNPSVFSPTITQAADIVGEKVRISSKRGTRRSFVLDFAQIMLFRPRVPCEGNFTFTKEDLLSFADRVRSNSQ